MTEERIKNLLQKADEIAGQPEPIFVDISAVRRRARKKRLASLAVPLTAAAMLLVALGIWKFVAKTGETVQEQEKIASLQAQIQQLQARTDATLRLIQEVLEDERRQRRLNELQTELANIPDPLEEIQKQVDNTAFILVYQADRMYRELNLKDTAVQAYNRVIELFPETRWADVARQRLSEIQKNYQKKDSKGDLLWKPQNAPLFS